MCGTDLALAKSAATKDDEKLQHTNQGPTTTSWRLIWCHERCHKHECEERRTAISEAAWHAGAQLVCLKKAGKFATWLGHGPHPPYVLLTDWREVKPCMQALTQEHAGCGPALTIVLAEMPQHFERASAWAQSLPVSANPVEVIRELGCPNALLMDLAKRLQEISVLPIASSGLATKSLPCEGNDKCQSSSNDAPQRDRKMAAASRPKGTWTIGGKVVTSRSVLRASQRIASSFVGAPGVFPAFDACFDLAVQFPQHPFLGVGIEYEPAPLLSTMPMKQAKLIGGGSFGDHRLQVDGLALPVADVLSPVFASRNQEEIDQLLREAMPDHYDE